MFILDHDLKSGIGILIEYYREEMYDKTKDKKWLKMNFIRDQNGYFLCSDRTYRKMASGVPLVKDDLYDVFLEKLGVSFQNINREDEETGKQYGKLLLMALKQGNQSEVIHLNALYRRQLKQYESYFYYQEYTEVIKLLTGYFKMQWMSEQQYRKLQVIFHIFDSEWQIMIKYLLLEHCYTMYRDSPELLLLREKLEITKHQDVLLEVSDLYLDMLDGNGAEAYEKALSLLPALQQHGYDILYLRTISIIAALSIQLHPDEMADWLKQMEDIAAGLGSKVSSYMIGRCFYSVGAHLLAKQKYDLAKQHLQRAIQYNPLLVEMAGIYLYYIGKIQKETVDLQSAIMEASVIRQLNQKFNIMEAYFKEEIFHSTGIHAESVGSKEKRNRKKKQISYIMSHIKPLLTKDEHLYIQIFQDELNELAVSLNQYQEAYLFRKQFPFKRS